MDIAAMSIAMNLYKVNQQAALSVAKMAMDSAKQAAGSMVDLASQNNAALQNSVTPHIGKNVDVKV